MFLENIIDNALFPLKSTDSVEFAIETMLLNQISALPVILKDEMLGFVESKNLLDVSSKQSIKKLATLQANWVLGANNHYSETIKLIGDLNAGCLVILDENKTIKGIISPRSVMKFLSESYSQSAEGSVICLEMIARNYSLNEITRIVENNDAKIIGLSIFNIPDSSRISIHIKLNTVYIEKVVSTFQRFGYEINMTFNSNQDESNLENRYQSLLKYLEF